MDYIKNSKLIYDDLLAEKYGIPIGCFQKEVSDFENKHNFVLPESYKQYLYWMGNDIHGAFKGSEWYLKDVEENTRYLDDLLNENDIEINHLGNPLCFFSHQGYMSAWFYLPSEAPNPVCYFFSEVDADKSIITCSSFSEFLLQEIRGIV